MIATCEITYQLGALLLHGVDADGVEWCANLEGWDSPDVRAATADRPFDDGLLLGDFFYGGRALKLAGGFEAPDEATWQAAWNRLASAADLLRVDGLLLVNESPAKQAAVRKDGRLLARRVGLGCEFDLALLAADPRKYAQALDSETVGLPTPAGGMTFNATFNLTFGTGSGAGGRIDALNEGTYPTRPIARITGPVVNPRIENRTAGQTVRFGITLTTGDELVIDFDAHSVVLNGTASRRSTLDPTSTWWELAAGITSEIHFFSDDASPTGAQLTLEWRSAWI